MILSLRQRHRQMVFALAVLLPFTFIVGIAARKPAPVMASLPRELTITQTGFAVTEWERADLFTKFPMKIRLRRDGTDSSRFAIQFAAPKDFVKPDLIAYWAFGNAATIEKLPDEAILLGTFNSTTALPLPAEIKPGDGRLVLYSLADQAIVEVSKPVTLLKQ